MKIPCDGAVSVVWLPSRFGLSDHNGDWHYLDTSEILSEDLLHFAIVCDGLNASIYVDGVFENSIPFDFLVISFIRSAMLNNSSINLIEN